MAIPAGASAVVLLDDVKDELGIPASDTTQDDVLARVIDAAVQKITDLCGPLVPVSVVEDHRNLDEDLVLKVWPVVSVESVVLYPGGQVLAPLDITTGNRGYELHRRAGVIEYPFYGQDVRVTYTAGRTTLPPTMAEALQVLISHLWRASKNRVGSGQRSVYGGKTSDPEHDSPFPAGFAMPRRASELLQHERKPPLSA